MKMPASRARIPMIGAPTEMPNAPRPVRIRKMLNSNMPIFLVIVMINFLPFYSGCQQHTSFRLPLEIKALLATLILGFSLDRCFSSFGGSRDVVKLFDENI